MRACAVGEKTKSRGAGRGSKRRRRAECDKKEKKKDQEDARLDRRGEVSGSPWRVARLPYEPDAPFRDARHQSDASSCPDNTLLLVQKMSSGFIENEISARRGFLPSPAHTKRVVSDGKRKKKNFNARLTSKVLSDGDDHTTKRHDTWAIV